MADYVPVLSDGPAVTDTAANATTVDVIGSKLDTIAGDSLMAYAKKDVEGPGAITSLPTIADVVATGAITMTAGAAGVAGAYAEVDDGTGVPAAEFRIVGICLDTPSAGLIGEVGLASGAGGAEVLLATVPIEIATDAGVLAPILIPPTSVIAASTRIAARITTVAGAETVNVRLLVQPV